MPLHNSPRKKSLTRTEPFCSVCSSSQTFPTYFRRLRGRKNKVNSGKYQEKNRSWETWQQSAVIRRSLRALWRCYVKRSCVCIKFHSQYCKVVDNMKFDNDMYTQFKWSEITSWILEETVWRFDVFSTPLRENNVFPHFRFPSRTRDLEYLSACW